MAGYWPSSFSFACLGTVTKSRSINSQKKTRPISRNLDRRSLVKKGFIIGRIKNVKKMIDLQENIFRDRQSVFPFEQDDVTLSARVANHRAVFG